MKILFLLLLSYLIGSINPAYFLGKANGFDIRTKGSNNAGASNVKILFGWKYFVPVVIFDISKSIIAALLAKYFFQVDFQWQIIAGCLAIIGHNFPFYLGFKGGKGFASYIGLSFFINWKVFLFIMAIALLLALITNYIVTATMILTLSVPVFAIIDHMTIILIITLIIVSLTIIIKHRNNFYKLLTKSEIGINGKTIGFDVLNK